MAAVVMGCAGVLGVAIALLLPAQYEATALIMPNADTSGYSRFRGLGSFADLAGLNLGDPGIDVYPVVAKSREVLSAVLATTYRGETVGHALNSGTPPDSLSRFLILQGLRQQIQMDKDLRSGALTIRYRHGDAALAAVIVNAILDEMNRYFSAQQGSDARQKLALINTRQQEVAAELGDAEEVLREFRLRNRRIAESPGLMLDEARLLREIEIRNRIYIELASQREIYKINETGAAPVVRVLDRAMKAPIRAWPSRSRVVLLVCALAAIGFLLWIHIDEWRRRSTGKALSLPAS